MYTYGCQAERPMHLPSDHPADYFVTIVYKDNAGIPVRMCDQHAVAMKIRFATDLNRTVILSSFKDWQELNQVSEPESESESVEPDLDRRLSVAMRLLAMTETETSAELPVLRKRIADALEYMDGVPNPNPHTLNHIRRYLDGTWDSPTG